MKRTIPRLSLGLPLALLLALACFPTLAAGLLRPSAPLVELHVVDRDSGEVLPQYRHHGEQWLPGEPGRHYAVRLRNRSPGRVLVVLSVDGINAVSGQTADPRQAGYVLGPWQTLDVDGWRKSLGSVARFVFVDPAASYAARTGRPDNIGGIGVAGFREARAAPPVGIAATAPRAGEVQRTEGMKPAPRAAATADASARQESAAAPGLGTGHGSIEASRAYATTFERQSRPAQLTQVRYDTWYALQSRGIAIDPPPYPRPAWNDAPQAFPGGFVADPPCCTWRR
ncbi:hypothetical protein [Pseudoxanthomonas koreensis]|uniref:hypothetical protein n=1 Tax=Pseudoxanthomonas koreensis TaxID=266061 RepID=UPI0013914238|nr:hypothetical protein [Pseudoxanthomonas koreensis]KAF1694619.1 hypothetical protein CSC64_04205 [Pseudoxanthomonas koreensis]